MSFPDYPSGLQPGDQLLCDLLRLDQLQIDPIHFSEQDWRQAADSALQHDLAPLLYSQLKKRLDPHLSQIAALSPVHKIYLSHSVKALLRRQQLNLVIKAFNQRQVRIIVLKGAFLAENIYRDPVERQMEDIDLLVKKVDLQTAIQVLRELGYQPRKEFWLDYEMKTSHELPSFIKSGCSPVELHWIPIHPTLPYKLDLEGVWNRAIPVTVAGEPVLSLSVEDLILHLCIHASSQHCLHDGLKLTYDVAAVLERYRDKIDWDILAERARYWHAEKPVCLMFELAQQIFKPEISASKENFLASNLDAHHYNLSYRMVFEPLAKMPFFPPRLAEVQAADSLKARFHLIWKQIFLSQEEMAELYPVLPGSWKILIYYPKRWLDLIIHRLIPAWKLVQGDSNTMLKAKQTNRRIKEEEELITWLNS